MARRMAPSVFALISRTILRGDDARFHMGPNGFLHGVAIERNLAGQGVVEGGPREYMSDRKSCTPRATRSGAM